MLFFNIELNMFEIQHHKFSFIYHQKRVICKLNQLKSFILKQKSKVEKSNHVQRDYKFVR